MAQKLGLGQYCGHAVRYRQAHGFAVTENRFVPGLHIGRHAHQHTHFTFVLRGSFTESYEGMVLECPAGATLLVPAGAPHTDRIGPDGAHTIGVELSPAVAERVIGQTGVLRDARVILESKLIHTGRKLYREFQSSDPASSLSMEALALEMLVLAARTRMPGNLHEPAWMIEVRGILHERFRERVSLRELAQAVSIHETHLARAFRRRHGCTVGDYVRRLRVDAAAADLETTDRSIALVAIEAGFYDQAHLCRVFRKVYGVSPAEHRAR